MHPRDTLAVRSRFGQMWSGVALFVAGMLAARVASAQANSPAPAHSVIVPGVHLISNDRGNLVVRIGAKESFVAGAQRPELVAAARTLLTAQHAPAVRFAVALAAEDAAQHGDGGWGATGAVSVAHEVERGRMAEARTTALPSIGFSEVVQLALSGDEAHVVHQPAGYSNGDAIVHLERSGVLLLGADYASNGYPDLDLKGGGSLAGTIQTIDTFLKAFGSTSMRFVPIRGPVTGAAELRAYRDMLAGVRDRVLTLVSGGATERDVVAAKPTAAFDARWGRGPVSGDRFAALAFHSLSGR